MAIPGGDQRKQQAPERSQSTHRDAPSGPKPRDRSVPGMGPRLVMPQNQGQATTSSYHDSGNHSFSIQSRAPNFRPIPTTQFTAPPLLKPMHVKQDKIVEKWMAEDPSDPTEADIAIMSFPPPPPPSQRYGSNKVSGSHAVDRHDQPTEIKAVEKTDADTGRVKKDGGGDDDDRAMIRDDVQDRRRSRSRDDEDKDSQQDTPIPFHHRTTPASQQQPTATYENEAERMRNTSIRSIHRQRCFCQQPRSGPPSSRVKTYHCCPNCGCKFTEQLKQNTSFSSTTDHHNPYLQSGSGHGPGAFALGKSGTTGGFGGALGGFGGFGGFGSQGALGNFSPGQGGFAPMLMCCPSGDMSSMAGMFGGGWGGQYGGFPMFPFGCGFGSMW